MKKVFLATTALGMLAAGSAFAGPKVTVGGYADFQVGVAEAEDTYTASGEYTRDYHTRTDTEIHIKVDGKTDNGLGYGAHIELNADTNQDDTTGTSGNDNAERTFLYVESGLGRVELGSQYSVNKALGVDASTFARATGGIGGDFYKYVDLDGVEGGTADTFLITPDLPTAGFPGQVEAKNKDTFATANKINYYSPRISGIQAGVSFTPDLEERGTANGFSGDSNINNQSLENVWNFGLNYQGQFDGFGVELAATGELGESEGSTKDDLSAYSFGASVAYAGFTVGGSYSLIDETGFTSTDNVEGDFYTVGAAYEYGPFAASVSYLGSELENGANTTGTATDAEFSNLSVGADYQLAPGLVPYVEVSFFEADDNAAGEADNDGTVFIVGTALNF